MDYLYPLPDVSIFVTDMFQLQFQTNAFTALRVRNATEDYRERRQSTKGDEK